MVIRINLFGRSILMPLGTSGRERKGCLHWFCLTHERERGAACAEERNVLNRMNIPEKVDGPGDLLRHRFRLSEEPDMGLTPADVIDPDFGPVGLPVAPAVGAKQSVELFGGDMVRPQKLDGKIPLRATMYAELKPV